MKSEEIIISIFPEIKDFILPTLEVIGWHQAIIDGILGWRPGGNP
jgi:hypothetical protein